MPLFVPLSALETDKKLKTFTNLANAAAPCTRGCGCGCGCGCTRGLVDLCGDRYAPNYFKRAF